MRHASIWGKYILCRASRQSNSGRQTDICMSSSQVETRESPGAPVGGGGWQVRTEREQRARVTGTLTSRTLF